MELELYDGSSLSSAITKLGCQCKYINKTITPSLVRYNFELTKITDIAKIDKVAKCLSARLHEKIVQRESKTSDFCLEFIRKEREFCSFSQLHENLQGKKDGEFLFGLDENNNCLTYNISDCPHLLVSGCTASGKSVFLNSLISSFCCYSNNTYLVLIDPKQVEFAQFENAKHLLCPIITSVEESISKLNQLCDIMDSRYAKLRSLGLQNNDQNTFFKIVVVIDELADLMLTSGKEIEPPLIRLAQKGRACGIHLILATQRPTVNVVTGLIKANIPCKIAFAMSSVRDSIVMLDHSGANELLGKGDCLVKLPNKLETIRVQAPYIDAKDIQNIFSPQQITAYPPNLNKTAPNLNDNTFLGKLFKKSNKVAKNGIFAKIKGVFKKDNKNIFSINELNYLDCVIDEDD